MSSSVSSEETEANFRNERVPDESIWHRRSRGITHHTPRTTHHSLMFTAVAARVGVCARDLLDKAKRDDSHRKRGAGDEMSKLAPSTRGPSPRFTSQGRDMPLSFHSTSMFPHCNLVPLQNDGGSLVAASARCGRRLNERLQPTEEGRA
jgi:hypothetical protein